MYKNLQNYRAKPALLQAVHITDKYRRQNPLTQALKQNNLMTTSQLQKQQAQRPPPRISNNNFPENRLQLDRHHLAVAQARPNPANAFR